MQAYGDNFIPVIPTEEPTHTIDQPFCLDPTCSCHENHEAIGTINLHVFEGMLTPLEANRIVQGRQVWQWF